MKKRVFNVLNFLSLNVLLFAIYLNFIHKDTDVLPVVSAASKVTVKNPTATQMKNTVVASTQPK